MIRPPRFSGRLKLARVVAILALVGCTLGTDRLNPSTMVIVGGNGQSIPAGTNSAQPLTLAVLDQYGVPLQGIVVTWAITNGGGTLSAESTTTGVDGTTSVVYTAGPTAGAANITATVARIGTLTFDETIT